MRLNRRWIYLRYLLLTMVLFFSANLRAQTHEATQLILNYEKLTQLREILSQMQQGYSVLSQGYLRVKEMAEGDFKIHEVFLDGLLLVSPQVRKYYKVAEIINYQRRILKEFKTTYREIKNRDGFTMMELGYLNKIYQDLFQLSLRNLEELGLVLTAGKVRMSDFERIQAVDRLYDEMSGLLVNLRSLNSKVMTLHFLRTTSHQEVEHLLNLNDLKNE